MTNFLYKYAIVIILLSVLPIQLSNAKRPLQLDEAANAYQAYSILKTEKDVNGSKFPIGMSNYGVYDNIILSYLAIPFIKTIGLNEIAIRMPPIIFYLLSIPLLCKLTKLILNKQTALSAVLIYIFSPWTFKISQTAFNANLLPFLYILATYLFILGIKKQKQKYLIISFAPWALTIYAFGSALLWTPFILILLTIIFFDQIPNKKISLIILYLLIFLSALPYLQNLTQHLLASNAIQDTTTRFQQISIFTNHQSITIPLAFAVNYLFHISLVFFFIESTPPYLGLLNLYILPLLCCGIWICFKNRSEKIYKLLLIIFFAYPILPSLIDNVPTIHPTRDIIILPWIYIIASIGLLTIWQKYLKTPKKQLLFTIVIILNIGFFLIVRRIYYKKVRGYQFQYSNKELVQYLKTIENKYDKIIIRTDSSMADLFYYNLAFYLQYDPVNLQHDFDLHKYKKIGKYEWQKNPEKLEIKQNNLYIFNYRVIPKNNIIKTIYNPDGKAAFSLMAL
ncbi:MAG: glycosyltransferase family 39 protein [Patescibacteria group bacterium]